MSGYALGPVKPWVRQAANVIGHGYNVKTIYGVASRSYTSDHPLGLALDFMVYGDKEKGDNIAAFVASNAKQFNVTYVIWYQHIWDIARASEGWRAMEDRGSITANHMDHVHVSFSSRAPAYSNATNVGFPSIPPITPINPFKLWPGGDKNKNGLPDSADGAIGGAVGTGVAIAQIARVMAWLADSQNWVRVGLILSGIVLLLFALIRFTGVSPIPGPIGKVTKLL